MKLIFKKISWRNFLSTGNYWNSVELDQKTNILIYGENSFGKSTILDALCFALYGKAFRNINKNNLINSINGRECLTEIEFETNNKRYKIVRGIKPNVFDIFCNDKLLNQDAANRDYQEYLEKNILRLNFKSFTQIVILGSASFTPFMQLSAADRRNIVEDLLDIQIFSTMNDLVKNRLAVNKENIQSIKHAIEIDESKKEIYETHLNNAKIDTKNEIDECNFQQTILLENNKNLEISREKIQNEIDKVSVLLNKEFDVKKGVDLINKKKNTIEVAIKKFKTEYAFFCDNELCPTCKQNITADFKITKKNEIQSNIDINLITLDELISKSKIYEKNYKIILSTKDRVQNLKMQLNEISFELKNNKNAIEKLENKKNDLTNNKTNIVDIEDKISKLTNNIRQLEESLLQLLNDKEKLEIISTLLKDSGIKTRIVQQYLPVINNIINKYLSKLEFFVDFSFDETFKETIKSRYRDCFSYYNFSEGEKAKINLAILFAWRELTKIRSSFSTNLLIMDEIIDGALDFNSIDNFLTLIDLDKNDSTVFVISPKGESYIEKFNKTIHFIKENGFSRIE